MLRWFPFDLRSLGRSLAGALSLALLACSGSGGPTEPDPAPGPQPAPQPGPPQPGNVIAGPYELVLINNSEPGQMVTLAEPDGGVIGLYRFREFTTLELTEQQGWELELHYEDERNSHLLEDAGRFKRHGDEGQDLTFESAVYGDVFSGRATQGMASDGRAETTFGFQRIE